MLVQGREILKLIPHRPPMVLIDALIEWEENRAVSIFTPQRDTIFCEEGHFQAPGLIENIAQTAAASAGYAYRQHGRESPAGFIGAIKGLVVHKLPPVGKLLETEIRIERSVFKITIIKGSVTCENQLLAECEMKIFVKEDEEKPNLHT